MPGVYVKKNKTGLQPVSKPVEQILGIWEIFFKFLIFSLWRYKLTQLFARLCLTVDKRG